MPNLLHRISRALSSRWHAALAAALLCALGIELFGTRFLATTEYRLIDVYMRRHAGEIAADPGIVVVDIDDASMAAMQDIAGLWAWPREIHADLLEALAEFKPRAVVFDIAFSERDLKRPKSDARLSEAIGALPNVYLPATRLLPVLDTGGRPVADIGAAFGPVKAGLPVAKAALELPFAVQPDTWRLGLINSLEDADGILRRYRLQLDVHGWRLPSLPARVARDLGAAIPAGSEFVMRWPAVGSKRLPYAELYRTLTERRPDMSDAELDQARALLGDKILVIGSSAASTFDHHTTPLGTGYPGVDVLALAIDNLKNGHSVRIVPPVASLALGALLILALALLFVRRTNPLTAGALLMVLSFAALAAADFGFTHNVLLETATPLVFAWSFFLCGAVGGYLQERRTREQAVSLFRRFLNPGVVRQIVDQGETVESLSGRTREVTVLFSDIRGFTTLSESRPPQEVVALLNRYFERQVEVVFKHGGTLDKFIGDCIMAFWGAPVDDQQHAAHAVAAALEMQDVLVEFKRELDAEGSNVSDFDVGIGVHSGPAVVGFIGAQRKLDYTAIGDTVNLASRVEGLTKGVARVLVTAETVQACGESAFRFQHHGAFAVKGRSAEVQLYEPMRSTP
ncbi:adenylate/guanylate cyclase domain-containing protein [Oxalobacteraceae bacterium OM1]|nr:adenylate/guanylate cyclase domain-containing protein [Oxalobacteraceae bacterium OM1]